MERQISGMPALAEMSWKGRSAARGSGCEWEHSGTARHGTAASRLDAAATGPAASFVPAAPVVPVVLLHGVEIAVLSLFAFRPLSHRV